MTVEYDGTRFGGFQEQPNARTIAGDLRAAIGAAVAAPITLLAAGRTDAGVHAEGQVVNFVTRSGIGLVELREAVNDRLPADVNVLRVEEAAAGFHARHQAIARTYRYQVSLRRDAFRKRYVWWVKSPLDESRLAAEAVALAGFHDFASFTDGGGDDDTTCRVMSAAWSRTGDLALFRIVSDRFLRGMVRRIVGVMVEVGIGRAAPGRIKALLADPSPGAAAAATAPPAGLFLERVDYLAKR